VALGVGDAEEDAEDGDAAEDDLDDPVLTGFVAVCCCVDSSSLAALSCGRVVNNAAASHMLNCETGKGAWKRTGKDNSGSRLHSH